MYHHFQVVPHFRTSNKYADSRTDAFSLLELLIALTVASILLASGVPALREYALNKKIRAAQGQLLSDLNFARHQAIDNNQIVVICPSTKALNCETNGAWQQGWMIFLDDNEDHQRQSAEQVIRLVAAQPQLTIRSSASRSQVRFSPTGAAPASNLSIVFCDGRGVEAGRKLLVSQSGRIRQALTTVADQGLCSESDA